LFVIIKLEFPSNFP
jgi:hypothetical protein